MHVGEVRPLPCSLQVFVELCEEDAVAGEDMIGELNYSMYGTRDAAQNRGEACASTMVKMGFVQGEASPCTFSHAELKNKDCHASPPASGLPVHQVSLPDALFRY